MNTIMSRKTRRMLLKDQDEHLEVETDDDWVVLWRAWHIQALALPVLQVPPCLTADQFLEIQNKGAEIRDR